jgi:hypothetical protein
LSELDSLSPGYTGAISGSAFAGIVLPQQLQPHYSGKKYFSGSLADHHPTGYIVLGRENPLSLKEEKRMPNWNDNQLLIQGKKSTVLALMERAASGGHRYVGPFNSRKDGIDWGAFTSIQMEALMKDDDLFRGRTDSPPVFSFRGRTDSPPVFSFHAFVPVPREVLLAPYDGGVLEEKKAQYPEWFSRFPDLISGYDWENRNWGVKWGATSAEISSQYGDDEEYTVKYHFDTPWGPPIPFLDTLASLYPELYFELKYFESGMGFCGEYLWEGGVNTFQDHRDIYDEEELNRYQLCPSCQASVFPEEIMGDKCPHCPE